MVYGEPRRCVTCGLLFAVPFSDYCQLHAPASIFARYIEKDEDMNERPTWDVTWMSFADIISRRSKCTRARVGCIIVDVDQNVLAASYNGPPPGFNAEGPCTNWCPRARGEGALGNTYDNCPAAHSEINAISRIDRSRTVGATAYVNYPPCYQCAKAISAAGVSRVVYRPSPQNPHLNPEQVEEFLTECGVEVVQWPPR